MDVIQTHSYYGRMDKVNVVLGIDYMMLDEHVKKSIEKHSVKFMKDLSILLKDFKSELLDKVKSSNKKLSVNILTLKEEVKILNKRINDLDYLEKQASDIVYANLAKKGIIKKKK